MNVNFMDLKIQYLSIKNEIDEAIANVIDKTAFAAGPFVKSFEENFAAAHGAKYCVGVNSGTAALHIALWGLGIGPGDEVIVPTNTFFATPEAVSLTGATPVFIDCEAEFYNIDPSRIEGAITEKTKAVIAVHLYGQPAKMDEIKVICKNNSIMLIEDSAQAHLAEYKGTKVGTFGAAGCFSFYPGKNLGAFGEGGAVVTNDAELYDLMMALRDHGSTNKYYHDYVGHNYRMEGLQGAVLDVKLKHLSGWTDKRRENADLYRKHLVGVAGIELPKELHDAKHVYHLFVIRTKKRDELIEKLKKDGIYTGIHYPIPCHLQKAYEPILERAEEMPVSTGYSKQILSLPMFPELTEEMIIYVCDKIKKFLNQ